MGHGSRKGIEQQGSVLRDWPKQFWRGITIKGMQGKISVMIEASQREAMAGPKEERGRERKKEQAALLEGLHHFQSWNDHSGKQAVTHQEREVGAIGKESREGKNERGNEGSSFGC